MSEEVLIEAKRLLEENLPYDEVVERLKESFSEPSVWHIAIVSTGIK